MDEVQQHINWIAGYIAVMDESNWRDIKLRCERQIDELKRDLAALASPERGEG